MSRPRRAAAEAGVLRDRSRTKPATPCLLEPLTPARMASFSSPVNLFGTPRGRPGPGRSLVNEPLFAFLCLFLRLTGLGTLVTGPGKSRGMFVHYLVPLMGLTAWTLEMGEIVPLDADVFSVVSVHASPSFLMSQSTEGQLVSLMRADGSVNVTSSFPPTASTWAR